MEKVLKDLKVGSLALPKLWGGWVEKSPLPLQKLSPNTCLGAAPGLARREGAEPLPGLSKVLFGFAARTLNRRLLGTPSLLF